MRRARDGGRYLEEKTFLMQYNPTTDLYLPRILSKFIDILLFVAAISVPFLSLYSGFADYLIVIFVSLILHLIINPIFEAKYGKTIGKLLFKIQVIDDFGQLPSLSLAYKRNLLSFFSGYIALLATPRRTPYEVPYEYKDPYEKDYHNRKCKTWVISDSEKETALKLIHES